MGEEEKARICSQGLHKFFVRKENIFAKGARMNVGKSNGDTAIMSISEIQDVARAARTLYVTRYVAMLNEEYSAEEDGKRSKCMSAHLVDKWSNIMSNVMGIPLGAWLSRCDGRLLLKHICGEWRLMVRSCVRMCHARRDMLKSGERCGEQKHISEDGNNIM